MFAYVTFKLNSPNYIIHIIFSRCKLIAIGNGTGCRETEEFINNLFEKKFLDNRYVRYCIVSEQGASIYSCSRIAKEEFPDLDVSFIGAISIARRLSDPLCELVKVEPKHLGTIYF